MKIEYVNGCTVSDIMIDGESFADCSDTKWGIMRQRLLEYLSNRVQSDEDLQDLLSWACEMYGITRHEYHCEQCGDDVYTTTLEL
jgi:hypothetical protein